MKNKIRSYALSLGLSQFGVCEPEPHRQALVFLFPYYCGEHPGNISLYARGSDYHVVAKKYLLKICEYIKDITQKDFSFEIFCDISPYNDKELARMAGLGFYGKNTLLINPQLGSYFFIGYIVTEGLDLTLDSPMEEQCKGCNACLNACPGSAIDENGVNIGRCLSDISQKKGELLPEEKQIFLWGDYIWGCDRCQQVCPHNRGILPCPLPEFSTNLLHFLNLEDIEAFSEKQFREKYKDRAFTWRGKKTLQRNILLKTEVNK